MLQQKTKNVCEEKIELLRRKIDLQNKEKDIEREENQLWKKSKYQLTKK